VKATGKEEGQRKKKKFGGKRVRKVTKGESYWEGIQYSRESKRKRGGSNLGGWRGGGGAN